MTNTKKHDEAVTRGEAEYRRLLMAEIKIARYAWRVATDQYMTSVEHFKIQEVLRRNRPLAKSYKLTINEKI